MIPPLPPGAGKYGHTLNWLIETAPVSAEYPHVKRPKATIYTATREEVENRDISRFMANFGPQIATDQIREYQGNILWTVDGFDSDPELCEIPEVREYYAAIHRRWPAWLFFSDLRTACLQMVAECMIPNDGPAKRGGCVVQKLQSFFDHSLPPVAWFHKKLGISPKDGVTQLKHVALYLGLPG
jgi:hypothetical protein